MCRNLWFYSFCSRKYHTHILLSCVPHFGWKYYPLSSPGSILAYVLLIFPQSCRLIIFLGLKKAFFDMLALGSQHQTHLDILPSCISIGVGFVAVPVMCGVIAAGALRPVIKKLACSETDRCRDARHARVASATVLTHISHPLTQTHTSPHCAQSVKHLLKSEYYSFEWRFIWKRRKKPTA